MRTRNRWCDCIRGYAILLVCAEHMLHVPPISARFGFLAYYHRGDTGVFVFYVLSGFLVTAIIQREMNDSAAQLGESIVSSLRGRAIGHFFARRVFRLQPTFLLFFAIYMLLPAQRNQLPVFSLLLPISNWFAGPYITWHLKTLHIEESYYLSIGLAALVVRSLRPLLWIVIATAPLTRVALFEAAKTLPAATWWVDRFPPLEAFAVGGLLAFHLDRLRGTRMWQIVTRRPIMLFACCFVALLFCGVLRFVTPFSYVLVLTWPLVFSVLSAGMIAAGLFRERFWAGPEWMRKIGLVSYTLYLFQQLPLSPWPEVFQFPFRWLPWVAVAAAVILGIPLWYRYAEMPLTNVGAALFPRIAALPTRRTVMGAVVGEASPGLPAEL